MIKKWIEEIARGIVREYLVEHKRSEWHKPHPFCSLCGCLVKEGMLIRGVPVIVGLSGQERLERPAYCKTCAPPEALEYEQKLGLTSGPGGSAPAIQQQAAALQAAQMGQALGGLGWYWKEKKP